MRVSLPKIALSVVALGAVVAAAAMPQLLGGKVAEAISALRGADPIWLAVGVAGFTVSFFAYVGSWRAGLNAAGGRICPRQAAARIGVGALVNSVAPAKLGDALKIALCSKAIDGPGRMWTAGGVYAALAAVRTLMLAGMVVAASVTGALPLWPVFILFGAVAGLALVGLASERLRRWRHVSALLEGFAALERSPRALATVLGCSLAIALSRLAATAAVGAALGLPHPLLAALVILPALDLAGVVPLTPGNVGIASGAVALALRSRGIGVTDAIGVSLAMQALQTGVSVCAGVSGGLYLVMPRPAVRRWTMRVALVGASLALAATVGVFVLDLA